MLVLPKPAPVTSPVVATTVTTDLLADDHVAEPVTSCVLASESVATAEYCRRPPAASGTRSSALVDWTVSEVTTGRNVAATVRLVVVVTEQLVPDIVVHPFQPMNSPCGMLD